MADEYGLGNFLPENSGKKPFSIFGLNETISIILVIVFVLLGLSIISSSFSSIMIV
jgi:hypothetical protein